MATNMSVNSSANANSLLQQAAQSIINGSTGNGSMDVGLLVTTLVNAKTAGRAAALAASQQTGTTQISAFGALSSALGALETGLTTLANGALQSTFTAVASGKGLTATPSAGAVAGTYTVGVTQIATAQALASSGFDGKKALGTGTLTLSLGNQSFKVDVNGTNNTLSGIAAAINSASNNPGSARRSSTAPTARTSCSRRRRRGSASTISVAVGNVANDNGLSNLGVTSTADTKGGPSKIDSANSAAAWRQRRRAGREVHGQRHRVDQREQLGVGRAERRHAELVGGCGQRNRYADADDQPRHEVAGGHDHEFREPVQRRRQDDGRAVEPRRGERAGRADRRFDAAHDPQRPRVDHARGVPNKNGDGHTNLAAIGVSLEKDGTLRGRQREARQCADQQPVGVAHLFNATNGVGKQLTDQIATFTKRGGMIDLRTNALGADLKRVTQQQTNLADYAAQLTKQYLRQFTALNALMAKMNSNTQYLTRLFGGANSSGTLANK